MQASRTNSLHHTGMEWMDGSSQAFASAARAAQTISSSIYLGPIDQEREREEEPFWFFSFFFSIVLLLINLVLFLSLGERWG